MTDEEKAAKEAVEIVTKAGGYVSFDDYDKAYTKPNKIRFSPFIAGWGSPFQMELNNGIISANLAVDMGYLNKEENGYRLAKK